MKEVVLLIVRIVLLVSTLAGAVTTAVSINEMNKKNFKRNLIIVILAIIISLGSAILFSKLLS